MAIREIRLLGDEVLRTPADEVEAFDDDLRTLVRDMFATMYHAEGIGLAAPQVGVSSRVFVVDVPVKEGEARGPLALVNPRVVEASEELDRAPEGCLSIPGLEEIVERPARVVVEALDPEGEPIRIEGDELFGRALQHEIDHLDGVLFLDRVSPLKRKMLMKKWRKSREDTEAKAGSARGL